MEVREGYKQTEVGVIPEDWEIKSLDEVCSMKSGETITSENIDSYSPFPCYGGNGLRGKTSSYTHNGNYALIGRQGALCGNIIEVSGQFFASEHAIVVTTSISTDIRWLTTVLRDMNLNQYTESTAQPGLSITRLLSLLISFPPKPEQEAIAQALSDTDALIDSLEKLIEKKQRIKQGAMQELLSPKSTSAKMLLGDIAHIQTGTKNNQDKIENGKFPFFVRSATIERINSFSYDEKAILVPGEGNIGHIFHYIEEKFDVHQRVYAITNFNKLIDAKYVYYYMKKYFGTHALTNSVKATVDSLRLPTFLEFEIYMPSYTAQQEIATILSDMDSEIEALETKLQKTREIKEGMMHELLTGRIRLI